MATDVTEEGTKPSRSMNQTFTDITMRSSSDGATTTTTTQKRFSFYDAREVQLQCEVSGIQSVVQQKQKLHRFNFYDPSLLANENIPNESKSKNTVTAPTPTINTINETSHRNGQKIEITETNEQYIRQHQEEKEQQKARNEFDLEVDSSPVGPVSSGSTVDLNLNLNVNVNEGKNPLHTEKQINNENTDAEEILRSLQETEDQRNQILQTVQNTGTKGFSSKVATTTATVTGVNIAATTAAATTMNSVTASNDDDSSRTSDVNTNIKTNNPYEDSIRAALTLLRKHKSPPSSPNVVDNSTKLSSQIRVGNDDDGDDEKISVSPFFNNENKNNTDFINVNANANIDLRYESERDRTPKEKDRLMQYRSYDEDEELNNVDYEESNANIDENLLDEIPGPAVDNAVLEAKLKSKQRQERMAKYASRLQEFKSNLAPDQGIELNPSSSFQSFNQDLPVRDQPGSSSRIEYASNNHGESINSELPNHIHPTIKPSLTDSDSIGLVSELSQFSNQQRPLQPSVPSHDGHANSNQHAIIEEEVQKGVEKVLVAILKAGKSQSANDDPLSRNICFDNVSSNAAENVNDALLQVLDEVLNPSRSVETSLDSFSRCVDGVERQIERKTNSNHGVQCIDSYESNGVNTTTSKHSISIMSQESANSRSRKSSVVDELLAEADDDNIEATPAKSQALKVVNASLEALPGTRDPPPPPVSCDSNAAAARYWADDEKKVTKDLKCAGILETETASSGLYSISNRNSKNEEIDDSNNEEFGGASLEDSFDCSKTSGDDEEDNLNSSVSTKSAGGEGEYEDEDEELNTKSDFDEDECYDNDEKDEDDHRGGVLGPLSRGGTTGVVLDIESDLPSFEQNNDNAQNGYFSSVVNYMTSALTQDEQKLLDNEKSEKIRTNYDKEAFELMRTLCAHLLPFGVDQESSWKESIPKWDDENPNEAGYRIIRLSKSQLKRVEQAFDLMITSLKHNSHSSLNGGEGHLDANFIRELEEAERLLDDEEKRNNPEKTKDSFVDEATRTHTPSRTKIEERTSDTIHPEFPGIKGAGRGEMGDLEYFHLPIIFKSHVTGFEPTKDIVLEPGNVVAGQYLVESELGSAAFSTAYRCIDLSSDDNDGHEEVCLKVIKNTKDFFDQSLDEIKILELLRQTGKCDENYILRVKTFFYYREHLIIVTELLRQNLFEFGKFILDNNEEPYFTLPRLAYITRQCLVALKFVHNMGLVHSDVKPENILLGSYSRAQIKLIDFGSSCYLTDRQSSYIQSRSYRAPEVVLGLPYDGKIDVWSLGCVVAEMYTGEVTFQNDSIVSMLSRIEAFRGSFPRHMIAQGRQCGRFFTKSGLLYEVVDESDNDEVESRIPPGPDDEESDSVTETYFDIFQPKNTRLSSRLGFDAGLMDDYGGKNLSLDRQRKQMFTDFVAKLLTIDPDSRPSAEEALNLPWMLYASSLSEDQIKYPSK